MMGDDEPQRGALAGLQLPFQPLELLGPELVADGGNGRDVGDVAIENDEMRGAPVEGIVGFSFEELKEAAVVALVVTEQREERNLAEPVLFDVEVDGPLGG